MGGSPAWGLGVGLTTPQAWGLGVGLTTPRRKKQACYETYHEDQREMK
jgi:hypothetical protein